MRNFDRVLNYKLNIKTIQPLHIGSSYGDMTILTDSIDKKPYIQANSLAGAFGEYVKVSFGEGIKAKLFGSAQTGDSRIVFSNAELTGTSTIEERPRVRINKAFGSAECGGKFDTQLLSAGASFSFTVTVYENSWDKSINKGINNNKGNNDGANYAPIIKAMFTALNNGDILLGGQKTNGCGRVNITVLGFKALNLSNREDLELWLSSQIKYDDITNTLNGDGADGYYTVSMEAEIKESLIVKSTAPLSVEGGNKFINSESIKNSQDKFFVPASSVKGVLKGRVYSIGEYMHIDTAKLDEFFGGEASNGVAVDRSNGVAGRVLFEDAVIDNHVSRLIHRVKIDKFTGGAYNTAKFDEKPVTGKLTISVRVPTGKNSCAIVALVMLALRDLACGVISLGGLSSIGRGFVKADNITVNHEDSSEIFRRGMNELKELGI